MSKLDSKIKVNNTGKFGVYDLASVKVNHVDNKKGSRAKTRANKESGERMADTGHIGGEFTVSPNPSFIAERLSLFDRLWAAQQEQQNSISPQAIKVTLPNGSVVDGVAFRTTPMDIAKQLSNSLAEAVVTAKVKYTTKLVEDSVVDCDEDMGGEVNPAHGKHEEDDGELWDLTRPLVGDCILKLLKFDDDAAKTVFWHSSSHILGAALENIFGAHLTIGPPLQAGFYYDSYMGTHTISEEDLKKIEAKAGEICKAKHPFQRLVVNKAQALEMFKHNPFKVNLITNKVPEGSKTTVYRCGPLIDLCMGPHLPNTGKVKAFAAHKTSSTNWLGQVENDSLQRVYGISFPNKDELVKWRDLQEKAKARDHRLLGGKQELFFFHTLSPGSAFWMPHGARIYNTLMKFIREQYWKRGYEEVITPNMFNFDLWKISGHAAHYKEDMFVFDVEDSEFGLKPMNCPAHCLMFRHRNRSYRELPIRMADFGVLHRNELSGALTGLTRVRRFQQDDAHIFCRADQIKAEILGALEFMKFVYSLMGMTYRLQLSTRPEKFLGEVEVWNFAEAQLSEALNEFIGEGNWGINPGDGAFYGPKIDIKVFDALERMHQCATVQLDFQLPIRFELEYKTAGDGDAAFQRPVMVHRAMLGSVERMVAILTEHFGGKWPFWLSPRQVLVVPVDLKYADYALSIQQAVHDAGFFVDIDDSTRTFPKKVREGQIAQYNYILVVGQEEVDAATVNVRTRDNEVKGQMSLPELIASFRQQVAEYK